MSFSPCALFHPASVKAHALADDNNGGTCVAVAGENFCIVAADTRMSTGFSILTRESKKIVEL